MEYFSEDHHKKPKAQPLQPEETTEEQKIAAQALQKKLNADLEDLKEKIDALEAGSSTLDKEIVEQKIAGIHMELSLDQSLALHMQDQIETLRLQEERFKTLIA
jgi:hypothetical protein